MISKCFAVVALVISTVLAAPTNSTIGRGCPNSVTPEQVAANEASLNAILEASPALKAAVSTQRVGAIPVAWHVINSGTSLSQGNIPDSQVQASISVLNAAYASTGYSFTLSSITRTTNSNWFLRAGPDGTSATYQNAMKQATRTGGASTLNIWSVGFTNASPSGLLGYSTWPWDYASKTWDDGVVILYSSVPGGTAAPYNLGQTLSHEVGHWTGLYHVFADDNSCTSSGDLVADTPAQLVSYGCPTTAPDTCPSQSGVDSIHNFMAYTDDVCMTQFTAGQATRLQTQMLAYRGI